MWHGLCLETLASRACVWKEGEERRVEREAGRGGGLGKPDTRGSPGRARLGPSRGPVCGCARPAPPRLQAGASPRGVSPTEAPTLPPSPPRKGRPAGRSAERRGQERGEGALGPPQPGSWPLQPRPLRGKNNNKKKEV